MFLGQNNPINDEEMEASEHLTYSSVFSNRESWYNIVSDTIALDVRRERSKLHNIVLIAHVETQFVAISNSRLTPTSVLDTDLITTFHPNLI